MSEFYVHIEERFEFLTLDVFLYERIGDGQVVLHQPGGRRYRGPINQVIPEAERIPLVQIPRDAAHQVLAALARQLGAVEHPEQLRKDFEHEQRRVDMFINAMLEHLGVLKDRL